MAAKRHVNLYLITHLRALGVDPLALGRDTVAVPDATSIFRGQTLAVRLFYRVREQRTALD